MNITNITLFSNDVNSISTSSCREWCVGQHFSKNYSGFIILLFFNVIMLGVFLVLYRASDKVIHNVSYLSEERLAVILQSLVKCTFLVNAAYGIYFLISQ